MRVSLGLVAPTAAEVAANPALWAGTSFDPALQHQFRINRELATTPTEDYTLPDGTVVRGYQQPVPVDPSTDPLRFVRSLDQITYSRYIWPWQQAGGNIADEAAVRARIEEGKRAANDRTPYAVGSQLVYVTFPGGSGTPAGSPSDRPSTAGSPPASAATSTPSVPAGAAAQWLSSAAVPLGFAVVVASMMLFRK